MHRPCVMLLSADRIERYWVRTRMMVKTAARPIATHASVAPTATAAAGPDASVSACTSQSRPNSTMLPAPAAKPRQPAATTGPQWRLTFDRLAAEDIGPASN